MNGVINKAFLKMAEEYAKLSPQNRAVAHAKVKQAIAEAGARGIQVLENPSSHRITLSASGLFSASMQAGPVSFIR